MCATFAVNVIIVFFSLLTRYASFMQQTAKIRDFHMAVFKIHDLLAHDIGNLLTDIKKIKFSSLLICQICDLLISNSF